MDGLLLLDPENGTPLHRQLYSALRLEILEGRLDPGARLPPTRSLAQSLSLSRATVSEAYEQLRAEGYLEGRAGSGTFVAPNLVATPAQRMPQTVSLSRWGQRAVALSLPHDEAFTSPLRFDLRPHGVASDVFPWDAWQAAVDRALREERSSLLRYPPPAGLPALQRVIATHLRRYRAVQCTADQVIVVNGAQQGLNLLAETLLDPGDSVAVEDPGYPAARRALEARDLRVQRVPVDGEGLVVDALRERPAPRLIHVTPSHQDPTGVSLSLSRRLALLQMAARGPSIVVEDDYDSEFRYEGSPIESLQSLDQAGRTVYMGSFSKSILPGLRIGYMVVPESLVSAMQAAKAMWDSGAPALDQATLAHFIQSGEYERHIRRMRRLYRTRRDALLSALLLDFGNQITIGERHGGLNMLITLHTDKHEHDIVVQAGKAGIALRSVAAYYSQPPTEPTFLIGFGTLPAQDASHATRALRESIEGIGTN